MNDLPQNKIGMKYQGLLKIAAVLLRACLLSDARRLPPFLGF
jgi:hypothetical protein